MDIKSDICTCVAFCLNKYVENQNPKGMICYNHGYADHIDCMVHNIGLEWSNKRGYIFFVHEHYGHGRSDGLYVYCDDFMQYVKHSSFMHARAKIKYGKEYNIPKNNYFLAGESLGGAITIHQAIYESKLKIKLRNNNILSNNSSTVNIDNNNISKGEEIFGASPDWNGMFLAAPMCGVSKDLRPSQFVEKIFKKIILPMAPKAQAAPLGKLGNSLLSPQADSAIKNKVENGNPLRHTARERLLTAYVLYRATKFINRRASEVMIPLLVVHNMDDRVTDPIISQAFVKKASSTDKEHKMFDKGGWHSIWHDVNGNEVYNYVENWMKRRVNIMDNHDAMQINRPGNDDDREDDTK